MIRFTDATTLALTKLRARKIRTGITIFISALLFGVLIAALITANGAFRSVEDFSEEGLNSRYLVMGNSFAGNIIRERLTDETLIERAKQLFTEEIAAKEAEAERLGIPYDRTTAESPVFDTNDEERLAPFHPITAQLMEEYFTEHPQPDITDLRQIAAPYHLTASYADTYVSFDRGGTITTMLDGVESFNDPLKPTDNKEPVFEYGLTMISQSLTAPFLLPNSTWQPSTGRIPIVISQSQAEKLLGLTPLDNNAPAKDKLKRIEQVYQQANNLTFHACYRNAISQQRVDSAIADATSNETADYQQPPIVYGMPSADSCGAAPVKNDTRSEAQKLLSEKQKEFNKKFGTEVDPIHKKLTFQVVGISPGAQEPTPANSAGGLLRALTRGSSFGLAIPKEMYNQLPNKEQFASIFVGGQNYVLFGPEGNTLKLVEFDNASDAKQFVDEQSCHNNAAGECMPVDKPFQLSLFGSNSVALDDLKNKFVDIFKITALIVITLATIIMSATIGRMIADGRRETAVFRAIGFKRSDISSVYVIYTLLLSGLVTLLALIIGLSIAFGIDYYFWQDFTVQAKLTFGAMDPTREFHFFAVDTPEILLVIGAVFASGLLGILLPLMRNIRRNPIKDMRDE